MRKFMVISVIDGKQEATFFTNYVATKKHVLHVELTMGGTADMYLLNDDTQKYEFYEKRWKEI